MYRVLYRKWRPTGFGDVIGQPQVTSTLKNEIKSGRISHAYLFTGSRGTGKTTCAKILAKAVNCLDLKDGEPCGVCENCVGISKGTIMDVVEMDAASNNSVNNIREVLDEVMFTPSEAKYRVYIIDEVHMLTQGAFNALLKTLEEPPSHVVFILATTEVHKIPATILSRCQRFDFNRISARDISARLEYIAKEENVTLDHEAAMLIAAVADGAMRDALSILDRCIGLSENISSDVVREATGLAGRDYLFTLAQAVKEENVPLAINTINELYKASKSISRLCEELTEHFRTLMLLKTMKKGASELIIMSPEEFEKAKIQAEGISLTQIVYCIDVLQLSLEKMFKGGNNKIEFETCMIKLCNPRLTADVGAMLTRIDKLERAVRSGSFVSYSKQENTVPENAERNSSYDVKEAAPESSFSENKKSPEQNYHQSEPKTDEITRVNVSDPPPPPAINNNTSAIEALSSNAVPMEQWDDVLEALKSHTRVTAAAFRDTTAYVSGNYILIDSKDDTPFKHLRNSSQREKMRAAIKEVTGRSYKLGPYKQTLSGVRNDVKKSKIDEFIEHISNSDIKVTIEE
ncbi:MAG: DNA polymerase III subunit gamma/tau [Clostridia bacterium]|nr:DNA polymerase III subunit gamma/tau [Clostridia bacterium]